MQSRGILMQTRGMLMQTRGILMQTRGILMQTRGMLMRIRGILMQTRSTIALKTRHGTRGWCVCCGGCHEDQTKEKVFGREHETLYCHKWGFGRKGTL